MVLEAEEQEDEGESSEVRYEDKFPGDEIGGVAVSYCHGDSW